MSELANVPQIRLWQRRHHDHIIRNEQDLADIREYIVNNPLKWAIDKYHLKE